MSICVYFCFVASLYQPFSGLFVVGSSALLFPSLLCQSPPVPVGRRRTRRANMNEDMVELPMSQGSFGDFWTNELANVDHRQVLDCQIQVCGVFSSYAPRALTC